MKEEINALLLLDFLEGVAEEKGGKLVVRSRPTTTKIFLVYPDCKDCVHFSECGSKWTTLGVDTNELARDCEEYKSCESNFEDVYEYELNQLDQSREKPAKIKSGPKVN